MLEHEGADSGRAVKQSPELAADRRSRRMTVSSLRVQEEERVIHIPPARESSETDPIVLFSPNAQIADFPTQKDRSVNPQKKAVSPVHGDEHKNDTTATDEIDKVRPSHRGKLKTWEEQVPVAQRMESGRKKKETAKQKLATLAEDDGGKEAVRREMEQGQKEELAARNELAMAHMDLADQIAWSFRDRGEDLELLRQEARMGIVDAAGRFDISRGVPFGAYANRRVYGNMQKYFREQLARQFARPLYESGRKYFSTEEELTQSLGRQPKPNEIAEHMGVDPDHVENMQVAIDRTHTSSLDEQYEEDGATLGERIPDPAGDSTADQGIENFMKAQIQTLLSSADSPIPARERQIMALRFFGEMTQRQIAGEIGISQMQVSRLIEKTLERMRDLLENGHVAPAMQRDGDSSYLNGVKRAEDTAGEQQSDISKNKATRAAKAEGLALLRSLSPDELTRVVAAACLSDTTQEILVARVHETETRAEIAARLGLSDTRISAGESFGLAKVLEFISPEERERARIEALEKQVEEDSKKDLPRRQKILNIDRLRALSEKELLRACEQAGLSEDERLVLASRLDGTKTQSEVAARLHTYQKKISRIEIASIAKVIQALDPERSART